MSSLCLCLVATICFYHRKAYTEPFRTFRVSEKLFWMVCGWDFRAYGCMACDSHTLAWFKDVAAIVSYTPDTSGNPLWSFLFLLSLHCPREGWLYLRVGLSLISHSVQDSFPLTEEKGTLVQSRA